MNLYGDLSDEDDVTEEDIDDDSSASADSTQCRYSVENSYNEEKEQACLALKEICVNTGYCNSFFDFVTIFLVSSFTVLHFCHILKKALKKY